MAKLRMKKIFICGPKDQRKSILELLQRTALVEIDREGIDDGDLTRANVSSRRTAFMQAANQADQALETLDRYAPCQAGLLSALEGPSDMDKDTYYERTGHIDEYFDVVTRINDINKKLQEEIAAIPKCQNEAEALSAWTALDVPLNYTGTDKTRTFIGSVAEEIDAAGIYSRLVEACGSEEIPDIEVELVSKDKNISAFVVFCHADDAGTVEKALRQIDFARAPMSSLIPSEEIAKINKRIAGYEESIAGHKAEIAVFAPERDNIKFAADYYRIRADKYDVLSHIPQSQSAFFITGYTPEKTSGKLVKKLEALDAVVELSDPAPDEDVPCEISNNYFVDPMESLVHSYAMPNLTEIDPSAVIACFYYIMFGLMLSDAGYGIILVLACGYILLKVKNLAPGTKKMMKLLFFSGISTTFWGFMFGSFFGDAVNVVATTFFNRPDIAFKPLWFSSIDEPIRLLSFAFLIGIIHLFTGMILKFRQLMSEGRVEDAICDVVLWLMFVGGAIIYLLSMNMITEMLSLSFILSPAVGRVGGIVAVIGCIGVVLMDGRSSKNPVLRLLLGLYGAYGITSWLSDILSYSRLLALGLATGCIAQVFNKLGTMLGNGPVGFVFFIIIFIFGNTLNLAINILGAYVHTNRLQFVEFFGKFYEGGGREFEPFTEKTRYYQVKEEI